MSWSSDSSAGPGGVPGVDSSTGTGGASGGGFSAPASGLAHTHGQTGGYAPAANSSGKTLDANAHATVGVPPPPPSTWSLPVSAPVTLVPCLKGKIFQEGAWIVCRGVWAMSEEQHANPELVSEFEFKINSASPQVTSDLQTGAIPRLFPLNGVYQGWFKLKKILPLKGVDKIEEKNILIKFLKSGEGEGEQEQEQGDDNASDDEAAEDIYKVQGEGSNRFGHFVLNGTFDARDCSIVMLRHYIKLGAPLAKSPSLGGGGGGGLQPARVKREKSLSEESMLPREGAGRIRKQSSFIQDFDQIQGAGGLATSSSSDPTKKASHSHSKPEITPAQRLAIQFTRCNNVHAEISLLPHAVYFLQPVDPISLNIPDYPLVIANPMDLSTIAANLQANTYTSPAEFAEHMRLIFKNAMTYNASRDNLVHIAAKDCLSKFEEKFKTQVSSLNPGGNKSGSSGSMNGAKKAALNKKYPGQNKAPGAAGSGGSGSGGGNVNSKSRGGIGGGSAGGGIAGGFVLDASMQAMAEMQRQMMDMKNELERLRNAVGHDGGGSFDDAGAFYRPLTMQEKKDLIAHISLLPASCMETLVQIVQQSAPERGNVESDEIEIPLDELDNITLRRIQAYVSDARKRQNGGVGHSGNGTPSNKRSRTSGSGAGGNFEENSSDYASSSTDQTQTQFQQTQYQRTESYH